MPTGRAVVRDVHEMVDVTSLLGIEVYRLSAFRNLDAQPAENFEIDPSYALATDLRDDGDGFRVSLLTEIDTPIGRIECGVLAEYEHHGILVTSASSEALTEYVNNVALMHVIPYVRQSIADITLRVFNSPLVMPILQRGQMSFRVEVDNDAGAHPEG